MRGAEEGERREGRERERRGRGEGGRERERRGRGEGGEVKRGEVEVREVGRCKGARE